MKKYLDPTMLRFIIVGVVNTLFGTAVMFFCAEVLNLGYWFSSGANYFFGSILSFILNKHFTFRSTEKGSGEMFRFIINIFVCWVLAYGMAKPLTLFALQDSQLSSQNQERFSMLLGMCLFTFLNYFGQRFFTFKTETTHKGDEL